MAAHPSSNLNSGFGWEASEDASDGSPQSQRVAIYNPDIARQVDERLGLFDQGEISPEQYEQRLRDSVDLIGSVWDFCFENGRGKLMEISNASQLQVVLRRFIVLTLMFRAKRLSEHSLRSICKLLPRDVQQSFIGLSRVPLSKIGLEAAKRFAFRSRVQKPKESIANYRKAAGPGHAKRKANAAAVLKQKACQARKVARKGKK